MSAPESKGCSKYGADMGRSGSAPLVGRVSLRRVRLDSGGYDKGGAYWGIGETLYYASGSEDGEVYVRASGRDAAKLKLADKLSEGARWMR